MDFFFLGFGLYVCFVLGVSARIGKNLSRVLVFFFNWVGGVSR